jgi:hypothetical protein
VRRRLAVAVLALAVAGWEPFRAPQPDVERGNRAYAEGRWDDAVAAYERARGAGAAAATVDYDVGTALLRKAEAMPAGPERTAVEDRGLAALARAADVPDRSLRARAHYNRGNALLGRNQLEDAIGAYKDALRADRDLEDARLNLEQALKRRAKATPPSPSSGRGGGQGGRGRGQDGKPDPGDGADQPGARGQPQDQQGQPQGRGQQGQPQGQPGQPGQPSPDAPGGADRNQGNTSPDTPAQPPGGDPLGAPRGPRPTPRSPPSPADRKLDELERSSRDLRREQIRRRAQDSYRPPTGPDW